MNILMQSPFPPFRFQTGHRRFRFLKPFCLLLIAIALASMTAKAQQPSDYAIQANIIYRFTKYIDWPDNRKSGDFIIGIVGDSPLTGELKSFIANKTVNNRKIVIKTFPPSAEFFPCHILFVTDEESGCLKKIATRTSGSALLLVSESEGLAQKGSCINFVIAADHLKLEINKNNIEERNLNIASELLQLGKLVN